MRIHISVLTLLALGFIPPDAQQIQGSEAKHAFAFGGIEYLPRWSMKNQHEFTPAGQEDLQKWSDMITMNIYSDARDGDREQSHTFCNWAIELIRECFDRAKWR